MELDSSGRDGRKEVLNKKREKEMKKNRTLGQRRTKENKKGYKKGK